MYDLETGIKPYAGLIEKYKSVKDLKLFGKTFCYSYSMAAHPIFRVNKPFLNNLSGSQISVEDLKSLVVCCL